MLQIFHSALKYLEMTFSLLMTFIGETFQTLVTIIISLQNTLQVKKNLTYLVKKFTTITDNIRLVVVS